jgi:hypothetical protein
MMKDSESESSTLSPFENELLQTMQVALGASHLCKYSVIVVNTATLKIQGIRATDDE